MSQQTLQRQMEYEVQGKEQLRLLRTPFGLEQRAAYVQLDRIHEELDEYLLLPSAFAPALVAAGGGSHSDRLAAAGERGTAEAGETATTEAAATTAAEAEAETAVSTVLIVGDQNAGKTSFLFCFSRSLFLQQLQLSSFLPLLRASFVNARLIFISSQQLLRMQQAPTTTQQQRTPGAVEKATVRIRSAAAAAPAPAEAAAATPAGTTNVAAICEPAEQVPAAAAAAAHMAARATYTLGSNGSNAAAGHGDEGSAGGNRRSSRRANGEDSSHVGERHTSKIEEEVLLHIARDELPFLDSDVARALVLFTLEDFLFFCEELDVPFSCWSRDGNKISNTLETSSSSCNQGNNQKASAAACSAFLHTAGIRYVAVHLLEFGGDHLDRLLRFFQLTSRGQLSCGCKGNSSNDNTSSSSESSPTTRSCDDECRGNNRHSSGGRHICSSRVSSSGDNSNTRGAHKFDSCPSGTGVSSSRSITCCATELLYGETAMGTDSATERAVAIEAAKQILKEEQQSFQQALVAKAQQEQLTAPAERGAVLAFACATATSATSSLAPPASACAHAVPPGLAARAPGAAKFSSVTAPAPDPAAAPAFSCAEEASINTRLREGVFSREAAAAAGLQDEAETVGHTCTSTAAVPAAKDTPDPEAQSGVLHAATATRGKQKDVEEGDGDMPLLSDTAEGLHKLRRNELCTPATDPGKSGAAEDAAEEQSSQSLQLLQVLRRSAQLLSEATHTLYFVNCSSLVPLSRRCTRPCCRVFAVRTERCFALDRTAFAAFVGRLYTLALVQQRSVGRSSRGRDRNDSSGENSSSREHRDMCITSSSSNGSNHSCSSAAEPPFRERRPISFICCRLPEPQPHFSSSSNVYPIDPDDAASGAGAAAAAGEGGEVSAKQLLERCCSCCVRENFNTAVQLLRTPHTEQQHQRCSPPNPAKQQQWFSAAEVVVAEAGAATSAAEAEMAASAPRAQDPRAANAGPLAAAKEVPALSHIPELAKTKRDTKTAQPVLPGARRGGAAVLGDEDRHLSAEKEDPGGCHHSVGAAAALNHQTEASEFRLFMQLLQEAAMSAVAAATSAAAKEGEEELVAAATEEAALRGSPRFLFVHALLHFMWAWHIADESDEGAKQTAARDAAVAGLPPAEGTPVATAAESAEEAVVEAATPFLNDDVRVADAARPYVSAQLVPETNVPAGASAARGEAASGRDATDEAFEGAGGACIGGLPSRGASTAVDRQVHVGDLAERERDTERRRQPEGDRRRPALTSVKAQRQLSGHEREKEATERFPPQLQQPRARYSSQMTVICSSLQLQAVHPVQLFHQPQRQQEPQAPVQRVSEQQQLENVEKRQLLPPSQQQAEEGQWPEQRGQDTWAQQQQNRRALDQTEQREIPVLSSKEQQRRERELADELDEQQEEDALLQPPFRVGAVVNLFATLLRLGCMPPQKEPPLSTQSFPAEAYTEEEPTALGGTSAAVAAGFRAALSPTAGQGGKKSHTTASFFDERPKTTTDAGSPSQLTARIATAAAAAKEADKEKENREAVKCVAEGKAIRAPTGELGRQLLLTFLQLARKQRHFVRLSTGLAEDAGETEAAGGEQRVPAAGSPLVPETAVLDIWFSLLDAVLLLNDEDEDGCFSGEASAVVEQRSGYQRRRSSRAFEATAAAAAPLANSLPAAGSSTGTPFPAAEAAARPAQASAAPAADAAAAFSGTRDVYPRTAADVQELCASFERLHAQLEQTVIAEEASFWPASTFIQLLPTLFAGLVEIGAASPYDASAAPFAPVLLELRWLQESRSASTAAVPPPPPTTPASSPSSVPSFLAVAPREDAKKLPGSADCHALRFGTGAAEEPEWCHFPPAALRDPAPAAKAAGAEGTEAESPVAAAVAAKAKGELQAPESVAFRVMKTAYGQPTTSLSTVSTSAPEGDGFDGTSDAAASSAAYRPAAEEAQRSETCRATAADYSTTPCTVAARTAAAVSSPKGRNVSHHSAATVTSRQCITLLLAPAGLLQQKPCIHHSKSGAAPAATSEQQRDGSAAVGETEERAAAVKGKTAPSAARSSGGRGASCGATAAVEKTFARGGPPVRMALQEQLFNFVYCSLQEAAWAGPLPAGFWRRETCTCWESCGSCNREAGSVCGSRNNENRRTGSSTTSEFINRNSVCTRTSLGTSSTPRGSSNSSRSCGRITAGRTCVCPVAVETPWLDCVEQCVLQALYTQVQALCTGLHRYSNCVAEEICSCSADSGAAARPFARAGDSQRLPGKTPAGVTGVAVLQPPQLQHVGVQLEQHAEKQEAKARLQQSGGGPRQVDQDVPSSRSGSRHRETRSLDWQPTYNLAAAEGATQTAYAITEVAATAHVLLQLAGDMALLARMKSCAPHGEAAPCYFDGCSGEDNGTLKGGDVTAEESPAAGSTVASSAGQTASDVKAHMSESTSEQAATAMGAEATQAHHAAAGAAGSTLTGAGAVDTSVRSRFESHCRGLEETRVTSGSATGSIRWWVEDQTCSPGSIPCRKIVVEVLTGSCSRIPENSSFKSSDSVATVFPVCGSSASLDVCTPQKQAEVLATLAHLLRCPRNSQDQQEQECKQRFQQRRSQQHINYLSNSRKAMTSGSSICGEEEAVAEQETQDPSEVFYLRSDNLSASSDTVAAAARTETAPCWRQLLCQLADENISLSFF